MKKFTITFWITTSLILLFEGVMPLFFLQSEESKKGMAELGYPIYFGIALTVCKVLGALTLIVPKFSNRLKEWAYAGFTFDFIFAFISIAATNGTNGHLIPPVIALVILMLSYWSHHKINPYTCQNACCKKN